VIYLPVQAAQTGFQFAPLPPRLHALPLCREMAKPLKMHLRPDEKSPLRCRESAGKDRVCRSASSNLAVSARHQCD
jgi:hypothetical protein